ncbi:oligosaccharide flippase family protein [Cohnella algarum]|uniref:oligosaccharide flippase family protein n=1 Tax=Cohnella algarum TaxID=2044859 RepID=UPI0019689AC6|nr:oligosaccharide flippase family protein [Cohnella algarum]MBN2981243.1 oligosaccharide flippase family protein [Cohnella algarum]
MTERRSSGKGSSSLLKGAALLGGAALLSKVIGTLQKIPLQNLAGDEAFGLYSAVYAFAVMWMTLAAAGVPVAVSALVAERVAEGDEEGANRVLRWSAGLLIASGVAAFGLLQLGADAFARWMGVSQAADAIRTSSLALLFAPLVAALRGGAQGRMDMLRPAASQLVEQCARVAFMLAALLWALRHAWSPEATAAAVHGGMAAGAAAGLAALAGPRVWRRAIRRREAAAAASQAASSGGSARVAPREPRRALLGRIAAVALPVAVASLAAPLFGLIDAFTLPRLLQSAGQSSAEALASFGAYNRGIALLQLIVMAAGSAAAALVPALTAARARGDLADAGARAAFAMRLAAWFAAAAAVGLALLARPVNVALFADGRGTAAMALLAFAAGAGALQAVGAALLQGLGDLRSPALHLAAAALVKAAANAALAPAFGIAGAALAAVAAYGTAAALTHRRLRRQAAMPRPSARAAGRGALSLAAMAAAVALLAAALNALAGGLAPRAAAALTALPCALAGAIVFAVALIATGALGPADWRALPGVAGTRREAALNRLAAVLRRGTTVAADPQNSIPPKG